ncbi:NADH-quinone oxidoreductase subunit NuoG [Buchnera aphidicola (Ceratoglyphina bambusae)]|uniref:NADH-quinone oxidoreductase subunit NuoG n=1 Tax=Buchnera aphidicola TaxID=9 RepID=UPI0031B881CE
MQTMLVDNKKYKIDVSKNLLHNCLLNNINIPYFCWHPSLGSAGSCRQCAVKYDILDVNGSIQSKIVMSCMTEVKNGMIIYVNDSEAYNFRKSIIEFLMLNHPHDCPVCSEGGNCHLQDMTVISEHNKRRYRYNKRTYKNQYLGKFISHEMNRCISCYRCVRFYKDYAGGKDFDVYGLSNNIYFGRSEDGDLENEHSGNLIEICPTGVFTDKLHNKNYSRKWDMQYAPSVCNFCSVGCNIIAGERFGNLNKIENRYNKDVNEYFICDLGRFGYNFVNLKKNPSNPFFIEKNKFFKLKKKKAINFAKNILIKSNKILGIGSSRSSIENNFSLLNFVGKKNFSNGMLKDENKCVNKITNFLKNNYVYTPTLKEIENYDFILIVGQDITITAPRMSLSVRQSVNNQIKNNIFSFKKNCNVCKISEENKIFNNKNNSSLFILSNNKTKLEDISNINYYSDSEDKARFLYFLEKYVNKEIFKKCSFYELIKDKVYYIYNALLKSKKPLFIFSCCDNDYNLLKSYINLIISFRKINSLLGNVFLTNNSNSIGVSAMSNISLDEILNIAYMEKKVSIILLEIDLYRFISEKIINKILKNKNKIIVLDHLYTKSMKNFNLSFPTKSFFESTGTILNYEARAQRFFKVFDKKSYDIKCNRMESWKWIKEIYYKINNKKCKCNNLKNILNLCIKKFPILKKIKYASKNSDFRISGQKIPRSPNRYSGRTLLRYNKENFKKNLIYDSETMFSFSMEGSNNFNNKISHIPFIWNPGINSSQAWNNIADSHVLKENISSGIKIFESVKNKKINYNKISFSKNYKEHKLIITKHNFLFELEEMSQFSFKKNEKIKYINGFINDRYANFLNIKIKDILEFNCEGKKFKIKIFFSKFLKTGYISLPVGSFNVPVFLNNYKIKKFKII